MERSRSQAAVVTLLTLAITFVCFFGDRTAHAAPTVSALTLNPSAVAGGSAFTATLQLDSAAPAGGFQVGLFASPGGMIVQLPATVTVPAGATSVSFSIPTFTKFGDAPVTITEQSRGISAQGTVQGVTVKSLTIPSPIPNCSLSTTAAIELSAAVHLTQADASFGLAVPISTDNTQAVNLGGNAVIIKSGATGTFTFNGTGNVTGVATITAGPPGASKATQVTLQPPAVSSLTPNSIDIVAGTFGLVSAKLECPSTVAVQISGNNDTAATVSPFGSSGISEQRGIKIDAHGVSTATVVTITASTTTGGKSAQATIHPAGVSSVSLSPSTISSGGSVTATVQLTAAAPSGGLQVTTHLNGPDVPKVTLPATVNISAGQTSATFQVIANSVTASTTAQIFVNSPGVFKGAVLTINPPPVALSGISISPASLAGGNPATGTVRITSAAPANGFSVQLSSNNSAVATLPSTVTVAQGQTTANFQINTKVVASDAGAIISAVAGATFNARLAIKSSLTSLVLSSTTVKGGSPILGTVSMSSAAPTGGLVVPLKSNNAGVIVAPSVTIQAGQSKVIFKVGTKAVVSNTAVVISAGGLNSTVTLTP